MQCASNYSMSTTGDNTMEGQAENITLQDLFKQMQCMNAGITAIRSSQDKLTEDNKAVKSSLDVIQNTLPEMKVQLGKHDVQINSFERDKRRRNLIIFNLKDENEETFGNLEKKICELLGFLLESPFNLQEIDFCRRLGKFQSGKHRPILLGLTTERKKQEILRNRRKLGNAVIAIREDFPDDVREKRRELLAEVRKLRSEGKNAFIAYDKLIIRNSEDQTQKLSQKRALSESPVLISSKKTAYSGNANLLDDTDIFMSQIGPFQQQLEPKDRTRNQQDKANNQNSNQPNTPQTVGSDHSQNPGEKNM